MERNGELYGTIWRGRLGCVKSGEEGRPSVLSVRVVQKNGEGPSVRVVRPCCPSVLSFRAGCPSVLSVRAEEWRRLSVRVVRTSVFSVRLVRPCLKSGEE